MTLPTTTDNRTDTPSTAPGALASPEEGFDLGGGLHFLNAQETDTIADALRYYADTFGDTDAEVLAVRFGGNGFASSTATS